MKSEFDVSPVLPQTEHISLKKFFKIITSREGQAKFAQSRVAAVEKYYGLFCETLGSVIRKSARLRDKGKSDVNAN